MYDLPLPPSLRNAVLFLDFDGTLVPIADTPDSIAVPEGLEQVLADMQRSTGGGVVIVSGREVAAIRGFLPGFEGDIYGAHGAERRIGGELESHPVLGSQTVLDLHAEAKAFAARHEGVLIELKQTGVTFHYRTCPHHQSSIEDHTERMIETTDGFSVFPAKMAVEIKPGDVSKGAAVQDALSRRPGTSWMAVFGDDHTDEDAMSEVNRRGGISVRVGAGETCATYRLGGSQEVLRTLKRWTREVEA